MFQASAAAAVLVLAAALTAYGQTSATAAPTPLSKLLTEAAANNPQIAAARDAWLAAKQVPNQAGTLPDPTFTYQNFSVGSPKPFAGYTTSNFAYIGIGASQEIPYPGKLRLRKKAAEQAADVEGAAVHATAASIADAVKTDYIHLAYLQRAIQILGKNQRVLDQLIKDATAHYAVGQGIQADVLQAQVERTEILRKITTAEEQLEDTEADLKGLLRRDQDSPNIVAFPLKESTLTYTATDLLAMARKHNPQIQVASSSVRAENAELASAKRDGKPDFGLGYMYQQNDRKYPDYYMFTFNVRLPRRGRVHAEVAEATAKLAESRNNLSAQLQKRLTETKREYVTAKSDGTLLREYQQGLIPQSAAAFRATLNSYANDRDVFTHVLIYFVNLLNMELGEAEVLANHETAMAHLETLTGAALR